MIYLRALQLQDEFLPKGFPFNLPLIQNFQEVQFTSPVTFLVGENGCGKSTLLEALASGMNAIAIGSHDLEHDETLQDVRKLAAKFRYVKNRRPHHNFFFRAEDCFGFTKRIIQEQRYLEALEKEFSETLTGEGRLRAVGATRGQRKALEAKYGANPDAFSHGESFLHILQERLKPGGLYIMDEPETPLSPIRQLSLISILKEKVRESCQFIISTHSPILMAFPDASILQIDGSQIRPMAYEDVEHVTLTRAFLNNPQSFIRQL